MMNTETAASMHFTNRKKRIRAMGALQMVMGCFAGVVALLVLAVLYKILLGGGRYSSLDIRSTALALLQYLAIAAFFFWTGVGSRRCRRWVRPVILSVMIPVAVMGVLLFGMILWSIPAIAENALYRIPGATAMVSYVVTAILMTVIFFFLVLVPVLNVLAYRGDDVVRTCEIEDPVRRWTDAVPLPVMGLAIWMTIGGLVILGMNVYQVLPLFGFLVTGAPAIVLMILLGSTVFLFAGLVFRLSRAGWWGTVVLFVFLCTDAIVTFARVSLEQLGRAALLPEAKVRQMASYDTFLIVPIFILLGLLAIGFTFYMLRLRTYYFQKQG